MVCIWKVCEKIINIILQKIEHYLSPWIEIIYYNAGIIIGISFDKKQMLRICFSNANCVYLIQNNERFKEIILYITTIVILLILYTYKINCNIIQTHLSVLFVYLYVMLCSSCLLFNFSQEIFLTITMWRPIRRKHSFKGFWGVTSFKWHVLKKFDLYRVSRITLIFYCTLKI